MKRKISSFPFVLLLALLQLATACATKISPNTFDGEKAYQLVIDQVAFGPRIPGSDGHQKEIDWIADSLGKEGWSVTNQEGSSNGSKYTNIIGKKGSGSPWIILGAHYDTRLYADHDPDPANQLKPVPGANDGASGVSVLLELARVIPNDFQGQIWLVFFDAEDQGDLNGNLWSEGATGLAASLKSNPDSVVVVDMIGDKDLQIFKELNSTPSLNDQIWKIAKDSGFGNVFIEEYKYRMMDDHLPFIQHGFSAIDIIDFDYPYWHTIQDTPDKVSAESLKAVGETLFKWIVSIK